MAPGWLLIVAGIVGVGAIACGWLLVRDFWTAWLQGIDEARRDAELRELAERRRSRRTDGRINRRTR